MKIIECPRDAMQGIPHFIPTHIKAEYLNRLLQVGFDTLDFGSFVSPKAIPQMRDTAEVLAQLDMSRTRTKLLAIIANLRGAEQAASFEQIRYLGFPLSVSETFQQRNTNRSVAEALTEVSEMQNLCLKANKRLVVYISMAFGNPYKDPYDVEIVQAMVAKLAAMEISIIAPSDTIGLSTPQNIEALFGSLIGSFNGISFGAHLHSTPEEAISKIKAAYRAGCRRFDGAIKGFGGCPMAKDELTGNVATEAMIAYFESKFIDLHLDKTKFEEAFSFADQVFVQPGVHR